MHTRIAGLALLLTTLAGATAANAQQPAPKASAAEKDQKIVVEGHPESKLPTPPPDSTTESSVTVAGQKIPYKAIAGTLTVGYSDTYDAQLGLDGKPLSDTGMNPLDPTKPEDWPATARIFYTAYFKLGAPAASRPVMFLYNGGPGSATMWLHMGSFGPRRVVTPDTEHQPAAPYSLVDNPYSLLDSTDLVFIDAPGTGFSRIQGKNAAAAFWGVDQDAHAFERFIRRFLTKYDRWNSPKYLFGESYGTPRSAVLSAALQNVDLNGIVLLSAILSFDNSIDGPKGDPGVDQAYAIGLPTYAATAFYHHKLPTQPAALEPFLQEVEAFALGDYESALPARFGFVRHPAPQPSPRSSTPTPACPSTTSSNPTSASPAEPSPKPSRTPKDSPPGASTPAIRAPTSTASPKKPNTTPRTRPSPPPTPPPSTSTFAPNSTTDATKPTSPAPTPTPSFTWEMKHNAPGIGFSEGGVNVMPDLAASMKLNPKMKVFLAGGYYDLATPFYEGIYEMHHLPIPEKLQSNISYHYYPAGHMIYVNEDVLHQFHDDVAQFIHATQSGK